MLSRELSTRIPKVIWEESRCHPTRQRMDSSAACASCPMATADESNHSAAGTLYIHTVPHHGATFSLYVSLCAVQFPPKNCSFPRGDMDPINVTHGCLDPSDPPPRQHVDQLRGCLYLPTVKHVMHINELVQHVELAEVMANNQ